MIAVKPSTAFARLSPFQARGVAILTLSAIAFCVAVSLSPLATGFADKPHRGAGDVDLYQAEVQRIADGENYYSAADRELHERGYPTRSIFNWRTPLPMWLIGIGPSSIYGRVLIGLLAALLLVLSMVVVARDTNSVRAVLAGVMLIGALMPCWLERIYVMPEVWAGVLIGLSICAYALDRPFFGVAIGLAALAIRELAAPYCCVCMGLSVSNRRWRETLAWAIGFAVYVAFYAWHIHQVLPHIGPNDRAHAAGWLQLGGAAFVISLAQMNMYLLLLPQWITAALLPFAMLGFASWNTPVGNRAGLTACALVIAFAFIGQPFNQYWGSLMAPLLCLGVSQAPAAIADLVDRSRLFEKSARLQPAGRANF